MTRQIDSTIDVGKWISAAEKDLCWVDGALCALGAEPTDEGIKAHGLSNMGGDALVLELKELAAKLESVARRLNHLADHADLTDLVESLKIGGAGTVVEEDDE